MRRRVDADAIIDQSSSLPRHAGFGQVSSAAIPATVARLTILHISVECSSRSEIGHLQQGSKGPPVRTCGVIDRNYHSPPQYPDLKGRKSQVLCLHHQGCHIEGYLLGYVGLVNKEVHCRSGEEGS